ncbi:bile acid:sodium symporter family protein [Novosphingobium sp. TH158]|uniref:bile acid:sodium symporter family protein n=1 Tax=Novosphingobium sp. TH158 TaxID=2067455 RepID=UPI000C7A31A1|nr:bile acid:sodium symporter family protein [Novosphingobium sp. TH158]PLK26099.1 bile acid:sodium symporter [Novosphingobium sp. TH158]
MTGLLSRMKIDGFLLAIGLAVALAFAFPTIGASDGQLRAGLLTDLGVALVFFLHGAAVAPSAMRAAAANWRLHILVQASIYVLFPLIGLAVWHGAPQALGPELRLGFFFLCAISSTISSSVAMTALARGNVPAAIFNATLSGLLGMVLTPLLLALVMTRAPGIAPLTSQIGGILLKLLLPFVIGQLSRPLIAALLDRHKPLVGKADRAVIVLIVYVAFCDAALAGMWTAGQALALLVVAIMCSALLALVLVLTTLASRAMKLSTEDEIAAVFCGSKKSLANGAPIAKVVFGANPALSLILVPLLLYHQIQLVVCAVLARRYCARSQG